MERYSTGTIYKIAKALNVTVESLLEAHGYEQNREGEYRSSFEVFKSNICHKVKDVGDLDFIINTLESDIIVELFQKKRHPEARRNAIPEFMRFNIVECDVRNVV